MTAFGIYLAELQKLRAAAGQPGYRRISSLSQQPISHTTVRDILVGKRLGAWHTTEHIIDTLVRLAHDETAKARIHELWYLALEQERERQDADVPPTEMELLAQILRELQEQRAMLERLVDHSPCEQPPNQL